MVIDPHQVDGEVLAKLAKDVLFIAGTHGYEASTMLFSGVRDFRSASDEIEFLTQIVGFLGVARLPSRTGVWPICDMFIGPSEFPMEVKRIEDVVQYVVENRALKWEDEVKLLIYNGEVNLLELKGMDIEPPMLARFAKQIGEYLASTSIKH